MGGGRKLENKQQEQNKNKTTTTNNNNNKKPSTFVPQGDSAASLVALVTQLNRWDEAGTPGEGNLSEQTRGVWKRAIEAADNGLEMLGR